MAPVIAHANPENDNVHVEPIDDVPSGVTAQHYVATVGLDQCIELADVVPDPDLPTVQLVVPVQS